MGMLPHLQQSRRGIQSDGQGLLGICLRRGAMNPHPSRQPTDAACLRALRTAYLDGTPGLVLAVARDLLFGFQEHDWDIRLMISRRIVSLRSVLSDGDGVGKTSHRNYENGDEEWSGA